MEISLPPYKAYFNSLLDGSITVLRFPKIDVKVGEIINAKAPKSHFEGLKLRIVNFEHPLLCGITVEEAKQEGYAAPDFCSMKTICGSIESRLDFESLAFDQSGDMPANRSKTEFDQELYERVKSGCRSCLLKKDEKDLFLEHWSKVYHDMENKEITKITVKVVH
jgi:hypothetical protein